MDERIISAPDAPLGDGDPTRRWAITDRNGAARFPGVTPGEARSILGVGAPHWEGALARISLPVLLSDGAGPHLLDADGHLVLALADHAAAPGGRIALGPVGAREQLGVVAPLDGRVLWRWEARAEIDGARRVEALDALEVARTAGELDAWIAEMAPSI